MEAMGLLLLEDNKVRRGSWYKGMYLYKTMESKMSCCLVNDPILCHKGYPYMLNIDDSNANDWEVYQEQVIEEDKEDKKDNEQITIVLNEVQKLLDNALAARRLFMPGDLEDKEKASLYYGTVGKILALQEVIVIIKSLLNNKQEDIK
jgi:hypothetical protein